MKFPSLLFLLFLSLPSFATQNIDVPHGGGATGQTGNTGAAGADGANDSTGASGATGQSGKTGSSGASGSSGSSGASGATGQTGKSGATGATGASDPSSVTNVPGDLVLRHATDGHFDAGYTYFLNALTPGTPGTSSLYETGDPNTVGLQIKATSAPGVAPTGVIWSHLTNFTAAGQALTKTSSLAWDAYAYSDQSTSGPISVTFTQTGTPNAPVGLSNDTSPTGDTWMSLSYAFNCVLGNFAIYESGSGVGPFDACDGTETMVVASDGTTVRYYVNSALYYTSLNPSTGITLFPAAAQAESGAGVATATVTLGISATDQIADLLQFLNNARSKMSWIDHLGAAFFPDVTIASATPNTYAGFDSGGKLISLSAPSGATGPTGASGATGATGGSPPAPFSLSTGTLSGIASNEIIGNGRVAADATITYAVAAANTFSCVANPVLKLWDCGTSAGACTSGRTEMAAITLTASATQTNSSSISSPTISAGHYWAWEIDSGTCASLNATGTAQ